MAAPILEARALSKHYGDVVALERLDLTVAAGETLCLLGANGAGKTTTLNLFLGFTPPTSGQAMVAGHDVTADAAAARAALGYVAEVVSLYPALSGAENLAFFASLAGRPAAIAERDKILSGLHFLAGAINRPASEYSKGMRQKLGLAIALMKGAQAILLDEPLSGLDPAAANDLVEVLAETAATGTALLISTHDIFRAKDVATRIGIMRHGRLVDITASHQSAETATRNNAVEIRARTIVDLGGRYAFKIAGNSAALRVAVTNILDIQGFTLQGAGAYDILEGRLLSAYLTVDI